MSENCSTNNKIRSFIKLTEIENILSVPGFKLRGNCMTMA